ncbi:uncharacterized protein LOC121970477 [Zingiber officinale]|uniref:uncharacterized protein LOC121970477 n=1 Tax=Zingiber officinale TaxID=94328 RepID=UPI001C4AFB59|nr:uncharacterized protein LOC121970477 [Zingiber officinale]
MIHQVINEMEKVGDSQPSSSEPVSPTSNEMMKEPPRRLGIGTPEICFEMIKSVLEKLKGGLSLLFSTSHRAIMGMVMIMGYLHTQKYKMELENERGDAINDAIKSITELDAIKLEEEDDDEDADDDVDDDNEENEEEEIKLFLASVFDNNDYHQSLAGRCMGMSLPVGRIPEIPIPEVTARRTEVLYHSEKETEYGNYHNCRERTVMAMDYIQRKTSRVSALQEIASRVPEVADTKITMEHSKNSRRWWQSWWS